MRHLHLPAVVLLALGAVACGGDGGGTAGARRDDPLLVGRRAVDALRRGDLQALAAEMDDEGRRALAADLDVLRAGLGEPAEVVPGLVAQVRQVFAADAEALRARAAKAPVADLLRFLARVRPVGGGPEAPAVLTGPGRATFTYRDVHGVARPLELVRGPDGWRVRAIAL